MNRVFLFVFVVLIACNDNPTNNNEAKVIKCASTGTWQITYFYSGGIDATQLFSGFNFTFGASNVLTASKGFINVTGRWSISDDNSSDDTLDDLHFNILFVTSSFIDEIDNDWNILEVSDTKIKLKDSDGLNGNIDYLTFEKI